MFLIQAKNDYSIGPSEVLGPIVKEKGGLNRAKLYPAFGTTPQDGHAGFACWEEGIAIWGPDVLEFLRAAGMPGECTSKSRSETHALNQSHSGAWMDPFLQAAIEEAEAGLAEGGIPIGSVIVHQGKIIGRGHNRRVQKGSAILHGEMDALENAGRQPANVYRECVLYTTLSPCPMCSGTILLYGIPRVIVGENQTFMGEEELLSSRGVKVEVLQDPRCIEMMRKFIREKPELWNEDIGV